MVKSSVILSAALFSPVTHSLKRVGQCRELDAHLQIREQEDLQLRESIKEHLRKLGEADEALKARLQTLVDSKQEILEQLQTLADSSDGAVTVGAGGFIIAAGGGAAVLGGVACAAPAALGGVGAALGLTATATTGWFGTTTVVTVTGRGVAFVAGGVVGVVAGVGLTGYGAYNWWQSRKAAKIACDLAEVKAKRAGLLRDQKRAWNQAFRTWSLAEQRAQIRSDLAEAERALEESKEKLGLGLGVTQSQIVIDYDFFRDTITQLQKPVVEGFEEMLRYFRGTEILSATQVKELKNITKSKIKEWQSQGVSEEDIKSRIPIYWYTLQSPPVYLAVSKLLNDKSGGRQLKEGQTFVGMRFIKWLLDGLTALSPSYDFSGQAYRVMSHVHSDAEWEAKRPGNIIAWHTLRSVATSFSVLEPFADDNFEPNSPLTIFTIQDCNAKKIASLSKFPAEEEVLLLPGTVFKVIDRQRGTPGSHDFVERADKITLQMLGNALVSQA